MLTVEQALQRVLAAVPRLPAESVPVSDAFGRILAEDLVAVRDVPGWDNSAMDGYAVRAWDTADNEVELALNEVVAAGSVPTVAVGPGTASAVMTGAPVPEGADAIVMVEDSDGSQQGTVRVRGKAHAGQHIRRRGEDITAGTPLLAAGTRLKPAALGLASSQGLVTLLVSRQPIVAILSTGDEVVEPGRPLEPGQLYSSNSASLAGQVRALGGVPLDAGNAADDVDSIVTRLSWCIEEADAVLTTGGVSVGEFDFVKQAFASLGIPMDFWKVQMKPGKPLAFGIAGRRGHGVPVFGLPGNPVSCMVNFLQFARPWLLTAMGAADAYLPVVEAEVAQDITVRPGRANLVRVVLESTGAGFRCRSTGNQSSGVLTSMVKANGLALLAPDSSGAAAGDIVRVQVLDAAFLERSDPGYGW